MKILDSSSSYFDFPSETTSNIASKMLANELWVVRQFNLAIFCLNVYGDKDETMNYSADTPRGGGTPLYGLYRYVPRNRVWFLEVLDP